MSDLISRADAIEALEANKSDWDNDYNRPIEKDIQSLKTLPSAEATGDLISRQWLLDLYDIPTDGDDVEWKVPLEVVRQNILDAPSAEAVQTQAEKCEDCIHNGTHKDKMTCKECVSAEAVDVTHDIPEYCSWSQTYTNMVQSAMSSADAVQGWISCNERLPSKSGDYLCTIPLYADETYTQVLTFNKGRFYEDDDIWGATYRDDVLAWMPLPTPYKGGDSE